MKRIGFVLIILSCISFVSCTSLRSYPIDYMLPAEITLPSQIRSVGIVNNVSGQPGMSVGNSGSRLGQFDSKVYLGDGKVATQALAQNIAEGNYFDQVIICDSALRTNEMTSRTSLYPSEITELIQELGVDMIVSLEDLRIKTDQGILYGPGYVLETLDATVGTLVKLYIPSRKEALHVCMDQDSIYWVTGSSVLKSNMLEEASIYAASFPIKHLIPAWTTSERFYFDGGCVEMRDASVFVKEQSWENAFRNWKKVYDTKKNRLKMHAAFNIGLYYELQDNFSEAMHWVTEACKMCIAEQDADGKAIQTKWPDEYNLAVNYLIQLERREKDLQKLNLQMSRFDTDF